MFIRKTFDSFVKLNSDALPLAQGRDWVIDWRWFCEEEDEATFTSERSLIECPAWARPKTPRHG